MKSLLYRADKQDSQSLEGAPCLRGMKPRLDWRALELNFTRYGTNDHVLRNFKAGVWHNLYIVSLL